MAMLALPEGEKDAWRRYRERSTVAGPWPAIEREIAAQVVRTAWNHWWSAWPADRADELHVYRGGGWALVRVTVEVLDGLP